MELTGKLIQVLPLQSGVGRNGKEWKNQPFIIETEGQYPKKIALLAWGQTVDVVQNLAIGTQIKCTIDIESREFNGKWYTDVKAFRVDRVGGEPAPQQPAYTAPPAGLADNISEPPDDLPF